MKYLIIFLSLLATTVNAQKVEILLIAVSHNYGHYPPQDFSNIHQKIEKFNPNAFFGEFLSREDEQNLMDYWCKADNNKRIERLKKNRNIDASVLQKRIDSLKKLAVKQPEDFFIKVDLAHAYYLNQDVANAHYQFWQVFSHLKQLPGSKLEDYLNKILSPELDVSGRSMKRLKTSEYAFIAFPMMQKLKIAELHPMDCQTFDLNWTASATAFYNKFENLKKDSTQSSTKELRAMLAKRDLGFTKYANIEKTSNKVTEWLNTNEAAVISSSGDFYFPESYELKNFPKEEMRSQIHWWLMRNRGMCENIVARAAAMNAKKVVVIVGANHRKYMQDILEKMPQVAIKNINELQ